MNKYEHKNWSKQKIILEKVFDQNVKKCKM
jgi:hypothetical protein